MTVPVRFYFRAAIATEELMSLPEVQSKRMTLPDLRALWKRLIVVGSPADAAVFAFQQIWELPASVQRPVPNFEVVWKLPAEQEGLLRPDMTKNIFARLWGAYVAQVQSTELGLTASSHRFGRNWVHVVPAAHIFRAQLDLELLLLDAVDASAARVAYDVFRQNYPTPTAVRIPDECVFCPDRITYDEAPAAYAPRHYQEDGGLSILPQHVSPSPVSLFRCRLCPEVVLRDESAWLEHLQDHHHGLLQYRRQVMALEALQWPRSIDQRLVRQRIHSYSSAFWQDMSAEREFCAVCALPGTAVPVVRMDLRSLVTDMTFLHPLFLAKAYLDAHATLYPQQAFHAGRFVGLPFGALLEAAIPVPFHLDDENDGWLLRLPPELLDSWTSACGHRGMPLEAPLFIDCRNALGNDPPRLPARALANGNLCLPMAYQCLKPFVT